jgi:hypothetical protein
MSMWLSYAKLSPSSFDEVRKSPSLVEALFFDSELSPPSDFDSEKDTFGEDYRSISSVLEAMEEDVGHEAGALKRAMGDGAGEELEYEFCYGPGFALSPADVVTLARELAEDSDGFGIAEFFAEAAKQGKGIVGGIS